MHTTLEFIVASRRAIHFQNGMEKNDLAYQIVAHSTFHAKYRIEEQQTPNLLIVL